MQTIITVHRIVEKHFEKNQALVRFTKVQVQPLRGQYHANEITHWTVP